MEFVEENTQRNETDNKQNGFYPYYILFGNEGYISTHIDDWKLRKPRQQNNKLDTNHELLILGMVTKYLLKMSGQIHAFV